MKRPFFVLFLCFNVRRNKPIKTQKWHFQQVEEREREAVWIRQDSFKSSSVCVCVCVCVRKNTPISSVRVRFYLRHSSVRRPRLFKIGETAAGTTDSASENQQSNFHCEYSSQKSNNTRLLHAADRLTSCRASAQWSFISWTWVSSFETVCEDLKVQDVQDHRLRGQRSALTVHRTEGGTSAESMLGVFFNVWVLLHHEFVTFESKFHPKAPELTWSDDSELLPPRWWGALWSPDDCWTLCVKLTPSTWTYERMNQFINQFINQTDGKHEIDRRKHGE